MFRHILKLTMYYQQNTFLYEPFQVLPVIKRDFVSDNRLKNRMERNVTLARRAFLPIVL